ncbi:MAG: fatty acyl-AMP ligase [Solirubrobacterales bacterium]
MSERSIRGAPNREGRTSGVATDPGALTPPSTFVDILRERAREAPDAEAVTFLDQSEREAGRLSFAELDRRARAIAAELQARGLVGERALLAYPPGLECVAGLFGCFYAGMVAVTSPPPDPGREYAAPRIRTVAGDARPRAVLTTAAVEPAIREVLAGHPAGGGLFLATDAASPGGERGWRDPGARPEDVALLQYTSGATKVPRGVMITHANLIANSELIARSFGHSRDSRLVVWLPPYHDMGLIGGIFQPVYGGFPVTLMSQVTFLLDPMSWLRAISRYRATVSGGPDFSFEMCVRRSSAADRATVDLSSWDLAFNGADLVRRETIDAFSEAFAPSGFRREAFYPCYGLAEATLMVTGGEKLAGPVIREADPAALDGGRFAPAGPGGEAKAVVGCGGPEPGSRVVVVDPETAEALPDGAVGEVWTSGPSVAAGYWEREAETAATFGAALASGAEGPFLRTGDLGFALEGELFPTGRMAELIVTGDRALYPTDVERACTDTVPALRPNCAAAFTIELEGDERLAIVCELRDAGADAAEVIAAVRGAIAERLELEAGAVALIEPRAIPRTTSGKVQRARCRALLLGGELRAVAVWPQGLTSAAGPV